MNLLTIFLNFRLLWPCIMNVGWRQRNQQMQLIWCLLSNFYLNMFRASLCPSSGEQECALPHMVFCTGCDGCGCVEIINIRLVASCKFLSLHPTFMMHGHKSLKKDTIVTANSNRTFSDKLSYKICDSTQRTVIIAYRLFGTTYRSRTQGPISPRILLGPWRCNRYCTPKRRYWIATPRCLMSQDSAALNTSRRKLEINQIIIYFYFLFKCA